MGGNQRALFRDAKADQKSSYKAVNEGGGCSYLCLFGVRQ